MSKFPLRRPQGFVILLAVLLAACPKRQTSIPEIGRLALVPLDSFRLTSQVATMCSDGSALLLPEAAGTNIVSVGYDLKPGPVVALPERITRIQGVVADQFSIYLFDDMRLLRLDRSRGTTTQMSTNVSFEGGTMLANAELAFSDGYSGRILTFDAAGSVSDLNVARLSFKPGALALGRDNNLYVLNQARQEVVLLDRVGDVVRVFPVPAPSSRIAVDDSLNTYLLEHTGTRIWQVTPRGMPRRISAEELGTRFSGVDLLVAQGGLFLLDNGQRVLKFQLPVGESKP